MYADAFLRTDESGRRVLGEEAHALAEILQAYVPASIPEILAGSPYIDPGVVITTDDIRPQLTWLQARNLVDRRLDVSTLIEAGILEAAGNGVDPGGGAVEPGSRSHQAAPGH